MNISFTLVVNGMLLAPGPAVEAPAVPLVVPAVEAPAPAEDASREATPVIPLGSSVLAPGLEAALEF